MARLEQALKHVRPVPALLLWGDRDRAVSLQSGQNLRQCFDRVEFELLPGTGHLPYEECPELLARLVNSFLTRTRQTETGPHLVRSKVISYDERTGPRSPRE
jgi:pimeloyl-ACP methyl ester carboxylesterase